MPNENISFNPLVSIALATYNGEKYLSEQLDSLLSQTYQNFEIVVSDDNSSDSTYSLLEGYRKKDSRIIISKNKNSRGFITNFTEAILACKGEIIFLCDQDDVWCPEKIAKHVAAYNDPSVLWAYNELVITDEKRNHLGYLTDTIPDYWTRKKLLYYTWGSCVLGCATSYRRSTIEKIWPADMNAPGHDSWIQLAIYPAKSAYIPTVLQEYMQHQGNVVGLRTVPDNQISEVENRATLNNLAYLKSLSHNKNLLLGKRIVFCCVFFLKKIRQKIHKCACGYFVQ